MTGSPMLLEQYILPLAVIVSASGSTATAAFAYQIWRSQMLHDRALFGEEELDRPGIVQVAQRNREALKDGDLWPPSNEEGDS